MHVMTMNSFFNSIVSFLVFIFIISIIFIIIVVLIVFKLMRTNVDHKIANKKEHDSMIKAEIAELESVPDKKRAFCSYCGALIDTSVKFCEKCGTPNIID